MKAVGGKNDIDNLISIFLKAAYKTAALILTRNRGI
jgi:hypothetical protein